VNPLGQKELLRNRPFIGARLEKQFNRWVGTSLRRFGWDDAIIGYTGYGSEQRLRVLARVIVTPHGMASLTPAREEAWAARRGYRNFFSVPAVNRSVRVSVGDQVVDALTDRNGYVDIAMTRHGLAPGWHRVWLQTGTSEPAEAPVLIVADDVEFGIVSDVDDTIITSYLPRLMIAARNSFLLTESARVPVPGMAGLYSTILRQHAGAPLVYVSTGAWGTQPFLERFTGRHGYPSGPMLLTDWGPTNTGWFRSGPAHKRQALAELARDFPRIRWLLVGDDGQHDPGLYAEFARRFPGHVAGIAIRELEIMEQVLAHGTPSQLSMIPTRPPRTVKEVRGPDGHALLPLIQEMLRDVR